MIVALLVAAFWFSFAPDNSLRQINGARTTLTWRAAGG